MPKNKTPKVFIIGVSPEGVASLSPAVCQRVTQAEIVFGGKRLLEMFPAFTGEKVVIGNNLAEVASLIEANLARKRMVVLASGDPGFYGIARYLTEKLGKDRFEIVPNVSSMQLAFARIGESWDDAALTSVHSRSIEAIVDTVRSHRKVGIITDDKRTPGEIARILLEKGVNNRQAYVCQDLGTTEESIVETDLEKLREGNFSPLNIVILIADAPDIREEDAPPRPLIGNADDRFRQPTDGHLITKLEVRAVSLARLALTEESIIWDIGAGSGAVAIEAALLARKGSVFAIEKNADSVAVITENVRRFGCHNVTVIHAVAPDQLEELPPPHAIFIGGSHGELEAILRLCCRRLRPGGRMVVNAITLETLHQAVAGLKANNFAVQVTLVNVARSQDILDLTRLEALNPVFVITGWPSEGQ